MLTAQQQRDAWRLGLLAEAGCATIAEMRRVDPCLSHRGARRMLERAEADGWAIRGRAGWVLCPPRVEREPHSAYAAVMSVVEQMQPGQVYSTTQLVERVRLQADWGRRHIAAQFSTLVEFGELQQVSRLSSNERRWMRPIPCASRASC